jgi:hypothetical protein
LITLVQLISIGLQLISIDWSYLIQFLALLDIYFAHKGMVGQTAGMLVRACSSLLAATP